MIDFAIAQVSDTPDGYRAVVRDMAKQWPDATGAQMIFVLVSASHAIERVFGDNPDGHPEVQNTLRVAALLGSDLFALQLRGNFAPTGRDLGRYWADSDPFFLHL